ncbi:MAG: hypothetical protein IJ493_02660 [Clostridia bacterium]|nr:hypothetical protein [Clostridia bacterium]
MLKGTMVDDSSHVVAVWDGSMSGTGQTVLYAMQKWRPITAIDPRTLKISRLY